VKRSQYIALFLILLIVVTAFFSVFVKTWTLPFTDSIRGSNDTPLGLTLGLDLQGGVHLVYETVDPNPTVEQLEGTIEVIRNRVDAFGVAEPTIQSLGSNRVIVQLPGVQDVKAAKDLIGAPAVLDFRELVLVPNLDNNDEQVDSKDDADGEVESLKAEWQIASSTVEGEQIYINGERLIPGSAQVGFDPTTGSPEVLFQFDRQGSEAFRLLTRKLIEFPIEDPRRMLGIFLDAGDESCGFATDINPGCTPLLTPVVQAEIPTSPRITGLELDQARILSIQLNAGAFPVPLKKNPIYERDVDAFLGADALQEGLKAGLLGIILVMLFMIMFYRMNGIVAALSLAIYAVVVLSIFKLIPVILTLSGMAAFILSLGFAVDANVLIFERIKEEIRGGRSLGSAIEIGFNRAWPAIRDGNLTTMIIAAILFWFGERLGAGLVQGFAFTLGIGVLFSMLTALFVTRRILNIFLGTPLARKLGLFS
jgi:preprotein translocase subunit SecD